MSWCAAMRHVHLVPAQARAPVHEALEESPTTPDGQHAWPAAPHAQVLERHVTPPEHVVPPQQGCPGPPQAHAPLEQTRFAPQVVPQQGVPTELPQAAHPPSTHW
jgi:hypothetical protein